MEIGVISDTHGSVMAWQSAISGPLSKVDLIVHLGDVLYHGARNPLPSGHNPMALAEAMNASPVPVMIVKGNCDSQVDQMVIDWPMSSESLWLVNEGKKIFCYHGHQEMDRMISRSSPHLVVTGHTHIPLLLRREGILYLNPGSVALPKGDLPQPTLARVNSQGVQILNLSGDFVAEVAWN